MDYSKELNESQLNAVTYCDGPSLVIAGAGSGKTRVLTYKIAYLLEEKGYQPWNILALTFTNKAAREMRDRIERQLGATMSAGLWMGTFHSIFARILRKEASVLGYTSDYTIYDDSDQKSLLKTIIKEMELDDKIYKPGTVASHISNAKNHLVLPQNYAQNAQLMEADKAAKMPKIHEIYNRYSARCKQSNAMDFDDLLVNTAMLFHYHPEVLERYVQKFQYVLVDEYQDTNFAQHAIVWQLTKDNQKVCVVGDDAQSIYSFRGARIDNILEFNKRYSNAKLFKLEQNYRSTQTIVQAANSLIQKNSRRIEKKVYSKNSMGEPIPVMACYSDIEEAERVVGRIRDLHRRESIPYDDFAILYRTNAQSRTFEDVLRKRELPYCIYGGLSFYQRKEIKDVIAYFRLVVNPNDEEAFKRIINYPARGIGDTTVGKIIAAANTSGTSLWNVLEQPAFYGLNVNKGTLAKLQGFYDLITHFRTENQQMTADQIGPMIVRESGIMNEVFADQTPENLSRQENIQELITGLHDFVEGRREEGNMDLSLRDYLSEVSLLTDQDTDNSDIQEKITLMTVHAAKGLEFNTVFVVGMEQDLFPSQRSSASLRELEEERRLFYVAITRAEKHCFLSFARSRFRYGKTEQSVPSSFLKDIDVDYLDIEQPTEPSSSLFSSSYRSSSGYGESSAPIFIKTSDNRQRTIDNSQRNYHFKSESKVITTPPAGYKKVSSSSVSHSVKDSQLLTLDSQLSVGNIIEHERFGIGEVTAIAGVGDSCKATVKFRNTGIKQLLLKFAKFKVIG